MIHALTLRPNGQPRPAAAPYKRSNIHKKRI